MNQPHTGGLVAFQSDRVEELVDRLVAEMAHHDDNTIGDCVDRPFVDHRVVLPTRNLETYLDFEIAARRGVSFGIEFLTMERFLKSLLPEDDDGQSQIRVLDQMAMTRLVVSLLDDPAVLQKPALAAVRDFIAPTDDVRPEMIERRKFQLAFRVGRLFEEYGYARQNMLQHWRRGDSGLKQDYDESATAAHLEIETWQMALWTELFGPDGKARQTDGGERPWMSLPEAVFEYAQGDDPGLDWPESVHIFGHSYLPRFFRDILSTRTRVADHRIALYVLNPSQQYWSHGIAGDRDEDPVFELLTDDSLLSGDEYPLALEVWGRAGRDYQRMIDDIAYDRVDVSPPTSRPAHTLLQHFQRLIRRMETAAGVFVENEVPTDEKSLNFWSCASIQRECEAVASEIWELVTTHEDLRFNDIAVVVQPGERTLYQTHLESAFEQTGGIPSNVIDVEGADTSPMLEAAELLLSLPLGKFRRRELLALLVHPCLVANYPEADSDAWMQWCDDVNIFQGAAGDDLDGTYLDEDRFTWEQGMRRLVLGAFMSQPETDRPTPMELDGNRYLPYETNHGDADTIALLSMIVDELITDARSAGADKRPLAAWMEYFADQISHYLEPRDRQQRRTRMRFLGRLGQIAESDTCPGEEIGYQTAFEFAMSAMEDIDESRGQYLADGVVVSAFRPMRPIPFEVVFVTGLGEGKFPAPDPPDMLDLRRVKSEPHDVNPRYQDQYMFLETLISTRSRLYLSWIGRHAITGDPIEPASAVHQLREMILAMAPAGGDDAEAIRAELEERVEFTSHPLRRYDDRYFPQYCDDDRPPKTIDARGPDAIPPAPDEERSDGDEVPERLWPNHHREARREAQTRSVRRRLDAALPRGYRPSLQELRRSLEDGVFASIADLVDWLEPPEKSRDTDADTLVLQLSHLRKFLQCPLQGSAKVLLGIYSEEADDVLDADHEPFEAEFLTRLAIVRQALEEALVDGDLSDEHLREVFDKRARTAALSGTLPAGVFFEAERDKSIQLLRSYAKAVAGDETERLRRIRFGGAHRRRDVDEVHDPLTIDVELDERTLHVELHGTVQLLDGTRRRSLVVAAGRNAKSKHFVKGGLAQIALRAADIDTDATTTVVTNRGKARDAGVDIGTAGEARGYLQTLLQDLLGGVHDYFLPVEFAAEIAGDDNFDHIEHQATQTKQPGYGGEPPQVSSIYGPVRRWHDADPPPLEVARDMIRRRYAPFAELFE